MSNTYKDKPYWVHINDVKRYPQREAFHTCARLNVECDIDQPITASEDGNCSYWLQNYAYSWQRTTSEEINVGYYRPERRAVKTQNKQLVKEFRYHGEVDDANPKVDQHHHSPFTGGWWN